MTKNKFLSEDQLTEDDEEYPDATTQAAPQPPSPGQEQAPPLQVQTPATPQSLAEVPWLSSVLKTIADVNETNRQLALANSKRSREEDSGGSSSKGKKSKITEPDPKDESLWVTGSYQVQDNGSTILGGLGLRVSLGGISADPKTWYQGLDDIVKQPRRGSSLVMTHLMGARILHPQVRF